MNVRLCRDALRTLKAGPERESIHTCICGG